MSSDHHILCIEDEIDIQEIIAYNLGKSGYAVTLADDGVKGLELAQTQLPDLVLLDIMLPGLNGMQVCERLKADPKTQSIPIIMLSARSEEADVISGLSSGADDYITKPYNAEELILRIRNLLKRTEKYKKNGPILKLKDMSIDFNKREVQINKKIIGLTFSEYQILTILVENLGNIVHKKEINKKIFNISEDVDSRTVDTHIHSLRKKINSSGCLINTIRSVGFVIETG